MKFFIKNVILFFVRIACRLYPYSINARLRAYRDKIYTIWLRNFIGKVGEDSVFAKPVFLQGGGQCRISIGNNTRIGHHTILGCWQNYNKDNQFAPEIVIGHNCIIGEYCHITAINRITIGDGLLTGRYVYIGDNSHGGLSWAEANIPPIRRILTSKGEVGIGNNVWLGDKVAILAGVHLGDNVIIGANSVVTHNIPSNCVAVGIPAKIIKKLEKKI